MSEQARVNVTKVLPVYVAPPLIETEVPVGAVVSIIIFLLKPSEPAAPGVGRVKTALLRAASLIVPLVIVSALVDV